jgi:hypothetical protein
MRQMPDLSGEQMFLQKRSCFIVCKQGQKTVGISILRQENYHKEDDCQLRDAQSGYRNTGHFNSENSFYWDTDRKPAGPHVP